MMVSIKSILTIVLVQQIIAQENYMQTEFEFEYANTYIDVENLLFVIEHYFEVSLGSMLINKKLTFDYRSRNKVT